VRRYTVVVVKGEEPGTYVAYVPALDVATQGASLEHALAMAKEASELVVEDLIDRGEDVPEEEPGAVVSTIEVEAPATVLA
jgi:predicted RNase H-like HicB family nuclease